MKTTEQNGLDISFSEDGVDEAAAYSRERPLAEARSRSAVFQRNVKKQDIQRFELGRVMWLKVE